jgi:transcriptional regulator with XRE-family HTH domain
MQDGRRPQERERDLARRITYERKTRGLSQRKLADLLQDAGCSIDHSAVAKIESGDRGIRVGEAVALAEAFKITLEDLLVPVALWKDERARQLVLALTVASARLAEAYVQRVTAEADLEAYMLAHEEMADYVSSHLDAARQHPALVRATRAAETIAQLRADRLAAGEQGS